MADNAYPVAEAPWSFGRISWGAVFGGVMVALGIAILFTTFGTFIGFRLTPNGADTWTRAWYLVTSFCALFAGGWAAGKLCGSENRGNRMLHGLVTWGLETLAVTAFIVVLAWGLLSGALGLAQTDVMASQTNPASPIHQQTTAAVNQAANQAATHGPQIAQVLATRASNISLTLFFGVLCGIGGTLLGSVVAGPTEVVVSAPRTRTVGGV